MSTPSTGGYVSPTFPDPNHAHDAHIIIYTYIPSFALCILAVVLFLLSFLLHISQVARYRTYYFLPLPLSLACVLEALGYVFRELSSQTRFIQSCRFRGAVFLYRDRACAHQR